MPGHYRPRFRIERRCRFCCNLFYPTRKDAQTCTTKCRVALMRQGRKIDEATHGIYTHGKPPAAELQTPA